jgi:hypothetical protein
LLSRRIEGVVSASKQASDMSIRDLGRRFALRVSCCYAALYAVYVGADHSRKA